MSLIQPVKAYSLASKKKLSDNHRIPLIQLGVYQTAGRECYDAVIAALRAGYRAIDSAEWYGNEKEVGQAIVDYIDNNNEGVDRKDIWFTTKLKTNSSYDETRLAIRRSIRKSGLGYIDLYLLHSPNGGPEKRAECWRAIEDAVEEREIKSGGVSNFGTKHVCSHPKYSSARCTQSNNSQLKELVEKVPRLIPSVNQIEVHPFNTRPELTALCKTLNITVEAYAPLAKGMRLTHPTIVSLSKNYGCTPAQLMVRWSLQHGYVALPKSVRRQRIEENADIGWFEISATDMDTMDALDEYLVTDWDPTDAD